MANGLDDAYERLAMEVSGVDMLPNDCTTEELVVASFKLLTEELCDLRRCVGALRDEMRRMRDEKR